MAGEQELEVTRAAKSTATFLLSLILTGVPSVLALVGLPLDAALAKGGNNGNGNSQGGGNQGGNSKGNGNANSHSKDKGNSASGSAPASSVTETDTGDTVTVSSNAVELRHANGISERLTKKRYQMRDAKGRTIIDRNATNLDRIRLGAKFN